VKKIGNSQDPGVSFEKLIKRRLDQARREMREFAAALGYSGPAALDGIKLESDYWLHLFGDNDYADLKNESWRELPKSWGERFACLCALEELEALLRPEDESGEGILAWAAGVDKWLALVRREAPKAAPPRSVAAYQEWLKRERAQKQRTEKTIAEIERHLKSASMRPNLAKAVA
jgi:hypothetical protein